jgi:hypothetical protein
MIDSAILLWIAALVTGAAAGLVFRRLVRREEIAVLKRKLLAHVLGLHLFGEEPAAAFDALREIVKTNGLLLWRALPGLAAAGGLAALVMWQVKPMFTATPLQFGAPAVLTVKFTKPLDKISEPLLTLPPWLRIDGPPVHVPRERSTAWRLRAVATGSATLDAAALVRGYSDVESATLNQFPMQFRFFGIRMEWGYWFGAVASMGVALSGAIPGPGSPSPHRA